MKALRKRLTYANVMSSIAVFLVVAGGSAFAAIHLGKNSVGSKQLKKNSVTAAKIKKNAITGAQLKDGSVTGTKIANGAVTGEKVNVATLPTVPSANLANSIPPAEATHLVGAPGQPQFENGSSNVPPEGSIGPNPVGFYKDHEGIVHLQGVVELDPEASLPSIFTLPPGFRPGAGKVGFFLQPNKQILLIGGSSTSAGPNDISGKLLAVGSKPESAVLDGITFRAES